MKLFTIKLLTTGADSKKSSRKMKMLHCSTLCSDAMNGLFFLYYTPIMLMIAVLLYCQQFCYNILNKEVYLFNCCSLANRQHFEF